MYITFSGLEVTANLLNLALTFFGSIAMVLVIVMLWQLVHVAANLRKASDKALQLTEMAEEFVLLPLQVISEVAEKVREALRRKKK